MISLFTDPRTCVEVGITECCNDETNTGLCRVSFRDSRNTRCSCDASCHRRNDCCEDAVEIGCANRKLLLSLSHTKFSLCQCVKNQCT